MMLSNCLKGNYKLVLIVDNVGIERNSKKIIDNVFNGEKIIDYEFVDENIENIVNKTNVVLQISKLELKYSEKEIFKILQRLKLNDNVTQIFGWASSDNIQSKILIPFLEHMSDIVATIKTNELLSILTKSKSGNVRFKEYFHELTNDKTSLKEYKVEKAHQKADEQQKVQESEVSTFKIGQNNANELEAKRNLKLPFELIDMQTESQQQQQGKIIYTPDNVDDFDEEDDPDNDLQF